ncbi:YlmC/YmxH family sporulation protein [Natribacillus halophilus]|uniref:Sporulation protein, YlmC/YmxH family n=1 Tax=Natribacillus halophilus TaxID=549003 RepID=A0A1G8MF23_9BACI|nr:YlmC/YmxH family sporulation protein [Natribacillus halophilus]SDI66608.1 sporulation protein, YlmC/YmxH family [Natribacillus halophilus]
MLKITDLQSKEVVNVQTGKRLGSLGDVDINLTTGAIDYLIITGAGRLLGMFGRDDEVIIPWQQIAKIGTDVILVYVYGTEESFHQ